MDHSPELRAWASVLQSTKTSTLKFALARAILDEVRQPDDRIPLIISREQLAHRLVQYYWYQVRQFRLKQASAANQEPNVVRRIRGLDTSSKMKWDRTVPQIEAIVSYVAKHGFDEVIPRFHGAVGGSIFRVKPGCGIVVSEHQRAFVRTFGSLLMQTVLAGWAAQVERYNYAPRVLAKVSFDGRRRTGTNKWAGALRRLENACFYCRVQGPRVAHVDHVIPWSFLFDDAAWNLVLACSSCNNQKRDSIPESRFLLALCNRNKSLTGGEIDEFAKSVRFSTTQLPYTGEDGPQRSIAYLCEQAFLQGFTGGWSPTRLSTPFLKDTQQQ